MIIENFGCLLTDNTRSKAYIQKLVANSLLPAKSIYVNLTPKRVTHVSRSSIAIEYAVDNAFAGRKYFLYSNSSAAIVPVHLEKPFKYRSFDTECCVLDTLRENGLDYVTMESASLNSPEVVEAVRKAGIKYCLFSGGAILGKEILSLGVRFIHIHPGYLPDVKGSMAIEWSILLQGKCAATAFFMEEKIDRGDIILRKYFDPPDIECNGVPPLYSSHIRSEVLLEIMRNFKEAGVFSALPQDRALGNFYYKMHPALHNIVLSDCAGRVRSGGA